MLYQYVQETCMTAYLLCSSLMRTINCALCKKSQTSIPPLLKEMETSAVFKELKDYTGKVLISATLQQQQVNEYRINLLWQKCKLTYTELCGALISLLQYLN